MWSCIKALPFDTTHILHDALNTMSAPMQFVLQAHVQYSLTANGVVYVGKNRDSHKSMVVSRLCQSTAAFLTLHIDQRRYLLLFDLCRWVQGQVYESWPHTGVSFAIFSPLLILMFLQACQHPTHQCTRMIYILLIVSHLLRRRM
jgi:hypothetical protein